MHVTGFHTVLQSGHLCCDIKLKHKVFDDYQMPDGHTSRMRSNKQYGALSTREEYSRKIKNKYSIKG
jgi:hypothetical protein